MVTIKPFRGLRPTPSQVKNVASRPYDVLNSEEAREEAANNPASFLHITKSEIDLPGNTDIHSQQVYDKAKQNLEAFIQKGILLREEKACYYIYQLVMPGSLTGAGDRSQTGLVCVSSIDHYNKGLIKKHELTRPDKELDRINHIKTTGAQTGNVFLAYNTTDTIHKTIEDWKASHHPTYDFIANDSIVHRLWVIDDDATNNRITALFAETIPFTYIADGHHRAASAAKVLSSLGNNATPDAAYFLTTLFPADQLHILDYNRLVKTIGDGTDSDFLQKLSADFVVEESATAVSPPQLHQFGLYLPGRWYTLMAKEGTYATDPISILDVSILQENVFSRILDIHDPRTDKRLDFVGGIRGLKELERRVNNGEMAAAFSLHPVTIQQLFDIADSGQVMPPKSTWFEPKLRDGLVTHLIYS